VTKFAEIIAQLEKAQGPDRELDAAIMFDLYAQPVGRKDDGGPCGYLWPEDNPSWSFGIRFPGKSREWFDQVRSRGRFDETLVIWRDNAFVLMNHLRVLKLTASVDAALTLVPAGNRDIDISRTPHSASRGAKLWQARIGIETLEEDPDWTGPQGIGDAETPAIAICIAALRAREALAP
jgi:hypothetical protein